MKEIRLLEQNVVLLAGYLARDCEVRYTQKGSALCSFTVGVTRRFKDTATAEWKDDVAWIPVVVWGESVERLKDKLKKGSPVHVEGRLRSEEYEDKTGQKRTGLKVVARRVQFLGRSSVGVSMTEAPGESEQDRSTGSAASAQLEEVPF